MFWDIEITQIDVDDLLEDKLRTTGDIESQKFFSRPPRNPRISLTVGKNPHF